MKSAKLFIVILTLFFAKLTTAQVSVNINLGSPPQWGPVGYAEARYYYLPDIECYYDIQTSMFIYYYGGGWVHRGHLPTYCKNYNLYDGYKVVMTDYHGNSPYIYFNEHKMKYKKGYKGPYQKTHGNKPGNGNNNNGGNKASNKGNTKNNKPAKGNGNSKPHGGGKGKK